MKLKIHIAILSLLLLALTAAGQGGQVLHFVDTGVVYLRWDGVRNTSLEGYRVYRRAAGETSWAPLTTDPIRPVYNYDQLSKLLDYKTGAYLQLIGADPQSRKNLTATSFNRVYEDPKGAKMLGVMSLLNPEYARALGELYEDRSIEAGRSYEYRITYITQGAEKEWATSSTINAGKPMMIALPKELKAMAGDGAVALDWKREAALMKQGTVVSYNIYRASDMLGPWQKENFYGILSVTTGKATASAPDNEHYQVFYLENGRKYYFTVRAVNAFGIESPAAPAVEATPAAVLPGIVSGFTIAASGKDARLSWNEPRQVEIYRSGNRTSFTRVYPPVAAGFSPIKSWYDRDMEEGSQYYYYLRAVDGPVLTDTVSWIMPDRTAPAPPANLRASAAKGVITLQWDASRDQDILGYEVERASDAALKTRSLLTEKPLSKTSFADSLGFRSQTLFGYVVYAVDKRYNRSKPSVMVTARMPDYQPPTRPYFSSLTEAGDGILLRWESAGERDIARYHIYRWVKAKNSFTKIGESTTETYTDASKDTGLLVFAVSAIDSAGNESAKSGQRQILRQPDQAKATPVNGSISQKKKTVVLTWSTPTGSRPAGFVVTRIEPSGKRRDIAELSEIARSFTDQFPVKGTLVYEVRSRNRQWQMGKPLILQLEYKP